MRIVKCSICGNYIIKPGKCYHCGNAMGFDEIEMPNIHKNVVGECSRAVSLVENGKFSEALALSHAVIEWMPRLAGIFWLRLLAKNKCKSTVELIQKGFNCEEDPDFCNALAFSNGEERNAYLDVKKIILAEKDALEAEILKHEYYCKIKTNVLQIKKSMRDELEARKKKLFMLWSELEKIEQVMYAVEKDCCLLSKEYCDALNSAAQAAGAIRAEVYQLEECSAEERHKFQVEIGNIQQQSEQAKEAMENIEKNHPWVKAFDDLAKRRDEKVCQITNEISSLKSYEAGIQQIFDEIDRIEQRHHTAICALESYCFSDAANLLGKECYYNILRSIGLGVEAFASIYPQD